ncbi:MAG TPA: NosD domain-containing protein, partial [Thermoanaerobaculia bacterium]|nr:NosD domain-containing protein [Thermoanaerobaculia bacterium]
MTIRLSSLIARVLLVAFSIPAGFASAATITSNPGFALDWNTGATWQGGNVPLPGDSVVIAPGSAVVIAAADSVNLTAITVQGGTSASPSESASLTVDGTLHVTGTTTAFGGTPLIGSGGTATITVTGTLITEDLDLTGGLGSVVGTGGAVALNLTGSSSTVNVLGNLDAVASHTLFTAGTPVINWSPSGGTVDVDGVLTVHYGNLNLDAGTLQLAGDFAGEGETIAAGTGTVILDGTAHQHWTGGALTLYDLVLTNNSADVNFENAAVTFDTTLDIAGTLTLSGGILDPGGYYVQIAAPAGLVHNSGHINGSLGRNVTGSTPTLFPVGTYDLYLPATVTPSTTGFMTMQAFGDVVWGAGANTLSANWAMQGDATLTTLDAVTFGYSGANVYGNEAAYVLARQDFTASPVTWERYATTLNTAADTASMSVANTPLFGYWTLGETASVTHATQLAVYNVNNGVQPKQNTPFDIVFQAQDASGNPATFAEYVTLELALLTTPAPTGTLTDVDGSSTPMSIDANAGDELITIPNLVYTAAESVVLQLNDNNFVPILGQVSAPITFGAPEAQLEVFTVGDDGPGTLRHAIYTANLGGCSTTPCPINFNLPPAEQLGDGTWSIVVPASLAGMSIGRPVATSRTSGDPLPRIDVPVILDGTTQPGFNPADPHPVVGIDGDGSGDILTVDGQGSTIRGLAFSNTSGAALTLQGNGNHVVEGCQIGITAGGVWNDDTCEGMRIGSDDNVVGGNTAAQRNVISGNWGYGIEIQDGAARNQIRGNYIGTDRGGASAVPNWIGVIVTLASDNTIAGNLISGNDSVGLVIDGDTGGVVTAAGVTAGEVTATIFGAAAQNHIEGNAFGYDAGGAELLNGGYDIEIYGDSAFDNVIGGPTAGEGNQL